MSVANRPTVISYGFSGILHAGLVAALLLWSIPARLIPDKVSVDTVAGPSAEHRPADDSLATAIDPVVEAIDRESATVGVDGLADVDASDGGLADFTRLRLQQAREEAESRSAPEQIDELESLAARLSSVSSAESLEQLTESIAPLIGSTSERATEPDDAADSSVPFDVTTAQIADVLEREVDGRLEHVAVMVDADGRTQQTPLDPADGETLYEVFQLMKQFPLLRTVYQKTVMGLLDRLLEEKRAAADGSTPTDEAGDSQQQDQQ